MRSGSRIRLDVAPERLGLHAHNSEYPLLLSAPRPYKENARYHICDREVATTQSSSISIFGMRNEKEDTE